MKHTAQLTDEDRAALLKIYSRLIARFGWDHVLRKMESGRLGKAALSRIK